MKFSINDYLSKCDQFPADLVTFTEEVIYGKLHFLCSVYIQCIYSVCVYIYFLALAISTPRMR